MNNQGLKLTSIQLLYRTEVSLIDRLSEKIITKSHNIVEQTKNPLLHAEIVAINQSCQILSSKNLSDCDMYVTLEPCTTCTSTISFARIGHYFMQQVIKNKVALKMELDSSIAIPVFIALKYITFRLKLTLHFFI